MVDDPGRGPIEEAARRELEARFNLGLPRTIADFDPLRADRESLLAYALPPRPDADAMPALYRAWMAAFETPARYLRIAAENLVVNPRPLHRMAADSIGSNEGAAGALRSRWGTSRNWSGPVIAARDGLRFTDALGVWAVPGGALPADAGAVRNLPGGVPGGEWRCSVWVGLDGVRRCSRSLPQMGTTTEVQPDGTVRAYLWVQWWVRDRFFGEIEVKGFDVAPHDRMLCWLYALSEVDVGFLAVNLTQKHWMRVSWRAGKDSGALPHEGDPGDRALAPVEGRHAVWCVERPSVMPSEQQIAAGIRPHQVPQFRLPDFGAAGFPAALALMRPRMDPTGPATLRDLTAARWLRMTRLAETPQAGTAFPPRVVYATTPRAPAEAGGGFVVAQRT